MKQIKENFTIELRYHWKPYLFQSLLASASIYLILLVLSIQEHSVIIASLGATSFTVFAMPKNFTANSWNIVGGHLIGVIIGAVCAAIPLHIIHYEVGAYALAVGMAMFLMVITDTEHPPAAGTALGMAMQVFSWRIIITTLLSVIVLALIHHFFKRYLRDLV